MPHKLLLFAALVAIAACTASLARPADQSPTTATLRASLDAQAPGWLESHDVPSVAIAYIADGRIAFTAVYGEQAPGVPATPDTLYNIASMTKPIVAETILRLASEDRLSLDESMAPWWVDPDIADDPRHRLLTPRMALSHRTGFPNWRYQTDDVLVFRSDPGEAFGYSGEGFEYLAHYAERRTATDLETLARREVFDPAGMTDTAFTRQDWFAGRVAVPQGPDGTTREPTVRDEWSAADDVHATVGDYARFVVWAMQGESIDPQIAAQRFVITEDQADQLCASGRMPEEACPAALGVGLGWMIYDTGDNRIVMHGGGDWGEHTLGFFVPESGVGAVIFTNGANGQKVIRDVVHLLLGDPSFDAFMAMQAGG